MKIVRNATLHRVYEKELLRFYGQHLNFNELRQFKRIFKICKIILGSFF